MIKFLIFIFVIFLICSATPLLLEAISSCLMLCLIFIKCFIKCSLKLRLIFLPDRHVQKYFVGILYYESVIIENGSIGDIGDIGKVPDKVLEHFMWALHLD